LRPRPTESESDRGRLRQQPTAAPNLDVVEAEVTETINLNSSRSNKENLITSS